MLRLTLLIISGLFLQSAHAGMYIDKSIVAFRNGEQLRQDIIVTNPDDTPAFIEVEVLEVLEPGTENESRTVVKNPEEIGLVASPRRLMVPPGGQRVVRLVSLNGFQDKEQVYRVNFTPVAGDVESDTMAVMILVAYQVLVFVDPATVTVDLSASRQGQQLLLENRGNVNVQIYQGLQCPLGVELMPPGKDEEALENGCVELPNHRLYPGNRITVDLPFDRPARYLVTAAGNTRSQVFE